jgi:hypothetical protein
MSSIRDSSVRSTLLNLSERASHTISNAPPQRGDVEGQSSVSRRNAVSHVSPKTPPARWRWAQFLLSLARHPTAHPSARTTMASTSPANSQKKARTDSTFLSAFGLRHICHLFERRPSPPPTIRVAVRVDPQPLNTAARKHDGSPLPKITVDDLRQHNTRSQCWVAVKHKVCFLTRQRS